MRLAFREWLLALLLIEVALIPAAHALAAEQTPSVRFIYNDLRLYCTELKDAEAMAQAIANGGEGDHVVPRPKTCYYKRITYEVVGLVSLHSKDNIFIKVVEVTDAAAPSTKYYLVIPTQFIPPGYRSS